MAPNGLTHEFIEWCQQDQILLSSYILSLPIQHTFYSHSMGSPSSNINTIIEMQSAMQQEIYILLLGIWNYCNNCLKSIRRHLNLRPSFLASRTVEQWNNAN